MIAYRSQAKMISHLSWCLVSLPILLHVPYIQHVSKQNYKLLSSAVRLACSGVSTTSVIYSWWFFQLSLKMIKSPSYALCSNRSIILWKVADPGLRNPLANQTVNTWRLICLMSTCQPINLHILTLLPLSTLLCNWDKFVSGMV